MTDEVDQDEADNEDERNKKDDGPPSLIFLKGKVFSDGIKRQGQQTRPLQRCDSVE